jgi:phenylalanyl-tRNA synthetase beta chain
VTAEKVEKAIKQAVGRCWSTSLCSTCTAVRPTARHRSLAYRLRLQALDRTLSETELTEVRHKVVAGVAKLGATLR